MSRIDHPAYMRPLTLPWIRRLFSSKRSDTSQHAARRYEVAFESAQARSLVWGLHRSRFDPTSARFASQEVIAMVRRELSHDIGEISADLVARERFGITTAVRGLLERMLRVPLVYTLGYVQQGDQKLLHTPLEELERMLLPGNAAVAQINLHAWLTLSSHEIIDVTYWAAFPELCSRKEQESKVLFGHPGQIEGRSYHPQLVGEEFVRKVGILKEYEKW
ncbi:hypothetical protein [Lysobacter firmicutimachus]|uniref:Uncharacterized protein n=1 Tax=Lysobacter firmicutimachus TaxID=1792846 RepID=A0ABU8CYL8_9GAMM